MPKTPANQHRWKRSVTDEILRVLEDAAGDLELNWNCDNKQPRSYPAGTEFVFSELKDRLKQQSRWREKPAKLPPLMPARVPEHFMDLIDERVVKTVYEDQNTGSYEEALRRASAGGKLGFVAWRKLLRSVDRAYKIDLYGIEGAPRPRVHFLHRELLEIVKLAKLNDLTSEGLVEFFDDLCPCGKKHQAEAIRKLGKRVATYRRPHEVK